MKKVNQNDQRILEDMHRLFSQLATLQESLSPGTQQEMLDFHNENFSVNHCVRWGEIGISEIRDEIDSRC